MQVPPPAVVFTFIEANSTGEDSGLTSAFNTIRL